MDVFRSPNRSLAFLISEQKSDVFVKAVLSILISDTADFLNVGKTMRADQIMQTIDLILEDYVVYKIDFFIACFNKAKKGHYGKQYDRLDGQIIFEWLTQYEYEYQAEIERNRVTEKTLIEQGKISIASDQPEQKLISDRDNTPVPMPDYVKELIKKVAKEETMPVKVIERTPEQLIIDGFIDDFNSKCQDHGSVRFFVIYGAPGKSMNLQEYIEYRVIELETGWHLEKCLNEIKSFHKERFRSAQSRKFK